MTGPLSRRSALIGLGSAGVLTGVSGASWAASPSAKIVIVGGGFGGATAARTLKALVPDADITLVESNPAYVSCPFSNLVVGGERDIADQTFGYDRLDAAGITLRTDTAVDVDPVARTVSLNLGDALPYDRLILSPGVQIRWNALPGYDEAAAEKMPHAWKAGQQTLLLRNKLEAMEDGGLVVMSAPAAPYRCPPGPYERASLIAHYLKTRKPRSKLIILDAKDRFSKMPLFQQAWATHYPDHLEWRSASNDGRVSRVDADDGTVDTDFEQFSPDVTNIIPPQKAGQIAELAGVADATGWCPIDPIDFSSLLQPSIHVIGDACIANPMPKSAFSAGLQGKLCALQIARSLSGLELAPTVLANTCYSYISPDQAVSISGVYSNQGSAFLSIAGAGGLSSIDAPDTERELEAAEAEDWFRTVTREAFG